MDMIEALSLSGLAKPISAAGATRGKLGDYASPLPSIRAQRASA